MSRLVEAKPKKERDHGAADMVSSKNDAAENVKEWGERVAKYVPAEVLAFYTGAVQLILTKAGDPNRSFRLWAFAILGVIAWVAVPLWLGKFTTNDPKAKRLNQIIGTIAFGVWAYAYPAGWFSEKGLHEPVLAGLLLLFVSFASGFAYVEKKS